ncbi:MAG: hypothetical protein OEV28_02085, partial [Nitrospirota bacterium]|nr:hypothetical protein [Nitrospirota bacterium]
MSYDPIALAKAGGYLITLLIPAIVYGYFVTLKRRHRPSAVTEQEIEGLKSSGTPFTLVDVREKKEFAATPREGAVNIPLGNLAYDVMDWNREGLYILACK